MCCVYPYYMPFDSLILMSQMKTGFLSPCIFYMLSLKGKFYITKLISESFCMILLEQIDATNNTHKRMLSCLYH